MTVVILEDAAEVIESGAQFYESCATGVAIIVTNTEHHISIKRYACKVEVRY